MRSARGHRASQPEVDTSAYAADQYTCLAYLGAYLDACGRNGGKPLTGPALQRFLPYNADPADLRAWAQPPPTG